MKMTTLCRILSVVFLLFSTSYGREIVVDTGVSGRPGTFPLIQAALDFANAGDEIVIRKGSYPESILITKAVSLKGEAGQVVTLTGNSHSPIRTVCRIKEAVGCTLENLVFKPVYSEPIRTPVVAINNGTVTIDHCTIQDGGSIGLAAQNQSKVKMNRCTILNHPEGGVLFSESVAEISNCRFEGNGKDGVRASGSEGRLTVADSAFANNTGHGLMISVHSSVRIRNCIFTSNQSGIFMRNVSELQLAGNRADQNNEHGIYLREIESSTVSQNVCENNGYNGIYIQQGRNSKFSENKCVQNQRNGFAFVGNDLGIEVSKNRAGENQWQGYYVGGGVEGILIHNEAILNSGNGIYVTNSDVSCRENLCEGNADSGICVENGSMGDYRNNTCRDNAMYGIAVGYAVSRPVCSENIFEKNKKGEIYIEEPPIERERKTLISGESTRKQGNMPQFAQVREMLVQGEYDKLDRIAADLIDTNKRNEEGGWQLTWFYRYLAGFGVSRSSENHQAAISAAEKWIQQSPKSQTPPAVLATMYCSIAWNARGNEMAREVTEEGWKVFRENLGKGLAVLDAAEKREIRDPEFYTVKLIIGRGLNKPDTWMQEAFQQGLSVKKDYQSLYQQMAEHLLPKWGGSSQKLRTFASSTIGPESDNRSHVLYAYIAAGVYAGESADGFLNHQLDYPGIKLGCEQLLALYPESDNNANRLCIFACLYRDKSTARRMFEKIENRIVSDIWKNDGDFYDSCRTWAFSE